MLTTLWQWLSSLWSEAPVASVDRTQNPEASPTLGFGITSDIGAVANGIGDVSKTVGQVIMVENTPQMIQGRLNAEEQAEKDRIVKNANEALKSGNGDQVGRDLS